MNRRKPTFAAELLLLGFLSCSGGAPAPPRATVITGAQVLDGTGSPARSVSVRIEGDRIAEVGDLAAGPEDDVIDGRRRVLAPGFIDTHSHADRDLLEHPDALAAVSQGITTVVVGQDGGSPYPLADFFSQLESAPAAVNVASYVGHGVLRKEVMGEDFRRPATDAEIEAMRELLRKEMSAGAVGLGTGLEYDPGIYSETGEVIALAREAAANGGRYISHIRSEDRRFWEAVDEIVAIGREAAIPVQISHLKLAMQSLHGQAERLIQVLDEARASGVAVTADIYPYPYWQSSLTVLFPDRDFEDREAAEFAVTEVTRPAEMLVPRFAPEPAYAGKTLAEIARMRGTDPATALIELIRDAERMREETGEREVESVIATSMDEADIERLMRWPHANIATDGELDGAHPRGFGTYPRVLGRYVRERGVLSLEEAIHKMTSLAAEHMGMAERGTIAPGMKADLVLFDPKSVIDRATPDEPHAVSDGIVAVWVNGELVYEEGKVTGSRPGRVIRRGE